MTTRYVLKAPETQTSATGVTLTLTPVAALTLRGDMHAIGITLPVVAEGEHPNARPFSGVLTRVDEPSTRPPHGSQGHRVLIPHQLAEARLGSLIGMAVDVSDGLTDHTRTKIGVITEAHLEGQDLVVQGYLYAKDFPEEVEAIAANHDQLGMSYEITNVQVADANADIWTLTDLVFTGAAILLKSAAAYERTSLKARRMTRRARMRANTLRTLEQLNKSLGTAIADLSSQAEEDDEQAGEEEDEDAKRGESEEDEDAKRGEDDEDAAKTEEADEEARGKQTADEAAAKKNPFDDLDEEAVTLARMLTGYRKMTGAPIGDDGDDEHDDQDQDLSMLKKLLTKLEARMSGSKKAAPMAASKDLERLLNRRLQPIEAAMELLTDSVSKMTALLTDRAGGGTGLRTDKTSGGEPNGGLRARRNGAGRHPGSSPSLAPQRKTLVASQDTQFLAKYGFESGQRYTTAQVDEGLRKAGISDPTQRIAFKHHLESVGMLTD